MDALKAYEALLATDADVEKPATDAEVAKSANGLYDAEVDASAYNAWEAVSAKLAVRDEEANEAEPTLVRSTGA